MLSVSLRALRVAGCCCGVMLLVSPSGPCAHAEDDPSAVSSEPFLDGLLDPMAWQRGVFPGEWTPAASPSTLWSQYLTRTRPTLYGFPVVSVSVLRDGGTVRQISVLLLDGGAFFGFTPDGKGGGSAVSEPAQRAEFRKLYDDLEKQVPRKLNEFFDQRGDREKVGSTRVTKTDVLRYERDGMVVRLQLRPDKLVRLTVLREDDAVESFFDKQLADLDPPERKRRWEANVQAGPVFGDRLIRNVPVMQQGWRAYCALSTFSMISEYFGVRLEPDEMAAMADFRYGEASSDKLLAVFTAVSMEGGVKVTRSGKFDFTRAKRHMKEGMPVLVFRRIDRSRDYLHTVFASRLASDPTATLPAPDDAERKTWPTGKDGAAHASVVTGYNEERGEVIFSESWGEHARDRRMRLEEMEATTYMAFYFSP